MYLIASLERIRHIYKENCDILSLHFFKQTSLTFLNQQDVDSVTLTMLVVTPRFAPVYTSCSKHGLKRTEYNAPNVYSSDSIFFSLGTLLLILHHHQQQQSKQLLDPVILLSLLSIITTTTTKP